MTAFGRLGGVAALVAGAGVLAAGLFGGNYPRFVALLFLVNALAVLGVNISMGFAGLVSVGHAGFAAIGAYVATLAMTRLGLPYLAALGCGAISAALTGIVIGVPALRLTPLYIAMVTFGFGQAVQLLAINWLDVTGGPNGMAVPDATVFGAELTPRGLFLLAFAAVVAALWLSWNIRRNSFGRALLAVRGNPTIARTMGINVALYKSLAFAMSAFLGGLSGGVYAAASGYINPDAFSFGVSVEYVTMAVVGGIGTLAGPLIGTMIFTLLPELLSSLGEYREFIGGIILLAALIGLPDGLVGAGRRLSVRLARAKRR